MALKPILMTTVLAAVMLAGCTEEGNVTVNGQNFHIKASGDTADRSDDLVVTDDEDPTFRFTLDVASEVKVSSTATASQHAYCLAKTDYEEDWKNTNDDWDFYWRSSYPRGTQYDRHEDWDCILEQGVLEGNTETRTDKLAPGTYFLGFDCWESKQDCAVRYTLSAEAV